GTAPTCQNRPPATMLNPDRIVMPSHIVEYVRGLRHTLNEGAIAVQEQRDTTAPGIVVLSPPRKACYNL
ncbi:MAG: hypothetical protein ABL935_06230, partial [Nitrospiraceae bacterium]